MIEPLGLTLCSYFANTLGFDTLLIQLNDTSSFSRLIAIFFCGIEVTGNLYFFRNLHLLSFSTIYNLPYCPLKWRAYQFSPRGHPRRSGITLRSMLPRDSLLLCHLKSHFLRISRIERHSQKIEFFFILPKHPFG